LLLFIFLPGYQATASPVLGGKHYVLLWRANP
jgi:hypothetical protein